MRDRPPPSPRLAKCRMDRNLASPIVSACLLSAHRYRGNEFGSGGDGMARLADAAFRAKFLAPAKEGPATPVYMAAGDGLHWPVRAAAQPARGAGVKPRGGSWMLRGNRAGKRRDGLRQEHPGSMEGAPCGAPACPAACGAPRASSFAPLAADAGLHRCPARARGRGGPGPALRRHDCRPNRGGGGVRTIPAVRMKAERQHRVPACPTTET